MIEKTEFNTSVVQMFRWKWSAEFYAWRARRAGYDTRIVDEGKNWFLLGGRWGVVIEEKEKK